VIDSGFVSSIDAATGDLNVNGVTVRLNDPLGVYGPAQPTMDPLWGVDSANPSVRTETGFPHCIPSDKSKWCTANPRTILGPTTNFNVANSKQFLDLQARAQAMKHDTIMMLILLVCAVRCLCLIVCMRILLFSC
jgi:hypothetical protein